MPGEAQLEALIGAVMQHLMGDAELAALAPGGVHLERKPQGVDAPDPDDAFVTVRFRPGGRPEQTLSNPRALRYVNIEVVGHAPGAGAIAVLRIDERFEQLLADADLTLAAPWTASRPRRLADVPAPLVDDGVEYDQRGGLYRIAVSGSAA